MRLYRHYKNKNYRLKGHVRHSETLEEMALYECLYPNDLGKTWVRPLEMFYGQTEVDGQIVPRFAPVSLNIHRIEQISAAQADVVQKLSKDISGQSNSNFLEELHEKKGTLLLLAEVDKKFVGYKWGYQQDEHTFYSWLGGVIPEYRGLGVAMDLMQAQHDWCRTQGYKKIQTKTGNQFPQMLILNIKAGFKIVNVHTGEQGGEVRIFMEKDL